MPEYAHRVREFGTTIFTEINRLADKHNAINLGQGRPDFDGPQEAIDAVTEAMHEGANQYPNGFGVPVLREEVAAHAAHYYGMRLNPDGQVLISVGASEGVFASIMGTVNPGDEVILIEPYFDIYLPAVKWAGGVPVYVPMRPPTWEIDLDALRAAFNDNTRAIVINTPHNPTGRVMSVAERETIAELCLKHDAIVISDEVYEHNIYDDAEHVPIATLPDMFERTLTVSSGAKSFSFTGWKVGWVMGPEPLVTGAWRIRQNISFTVNHPAQYGIARALQLGDTYFQQYRQMYLTKRDILMQGVRAAGLKAEVPPGAFYIMADFSDLFDGDDTAFTRHLIEHVGVGCIPPSAFFSPEHKHVTRNYVRFCYAKDNQTLHEASERLLKLKETV